ncbi:MAG: preprotein translocase subunit YajC [Pseudomonadota bacterium]|nr:preprotein translocase subunit YajC [Pseudomonadota bacterium]MDE3037187.1 preprotein translocase subunit YajC [Pseudomonadota bacterium]
MASGAAADTTTSTGAAAQVPYDLSPGKMMQDNLFVLGLIFFIFYFLLIRPQQKRLSAHKALMKSLAKGNKVLTTGGLVGVIVKFEGDDIVIVEIAPSVRVRIGRAAITDVLDEKAVAGEGANDN